jgi:hypothetical protein
LMALCSAASTLIRVKIVVPTCGSLLCMESASIESDTFNFNNQRRYQQEIKRFPEAV